MSIRFSASFTDHWRQLLGGVRAGGAGGGAAGIAGGYRMLFIALGMVVGVGGPEGAQLTSMATVLVGRCRVW